MSDTLERVKSVTGQILKIDPSGIADDAKFAQDLSATSLQSVELIAALETPAYVARCAALKPKYIVRAKKAIKRAFQYQLDGQCFSLIELVSNCPTNWGLTPLESIKWAEETMLPYFQLGEFKTPE